MSEPDPEESIWRGVAQKVAELFGLTTGRSPMLTETINNGVRYVKVDHGEILFDTRALMLGMLAAGGPTPSGVRYGSAASWFRDWLAERVGEPAIDGALSANATPAKSVMEVSSPDPVILSASVKALVESAASISSRTIGTAAFEGRHLFAAMIEKGTVTDQARQLFKLELGPSEQEALKRLLTDRIRETAGPDETREKWLVVLSLPPESTPTPDPKPRGKKQPRPRRGSPEILPPVTPTPQTTPIDGITPFNRDSVRRGGNLLDTERDVGALARLICLKDSTPLAVAIFGGWGSGKSTFMEALDGGIREVTGVEEDRLAECGDEERDAGRFVTRIVQIRFNAWQFIDANLWASLTAEFFDQLRAGGWDRAGKMRHTGLVERVNSHVHSLTADASARRQAAIKSGEGVRDAQKTRDDAAVAAAGAEGKAFGQAAADALGEIYEAQKANLTRLGMATAGVNAGASVDAIVDVVRSSHSILRQARAVFRLLAKSWRRLFWAGASVLALGVIAWLFLWGGIGRAQIAAVATALGALGTFAAAIAPALRIVMSVSRRGGDIARAVDANNEEAVKTLMRSEIELRDVTAEAEALEQAAARADRALARYIDPAGSANPPRLLRYVLEDDPDTRSFEKEIGLIGRARRVFQAVDDIIREEAAKPARERIDGDVPDRIVLYIDDLDRCTEKQVYDVLQAIHLLLAFDSFAVVVGVDVKWIENALAQEFGEDRGPELTDIERRQHAVHYLEKIFQVAFWLDPLSTEGSDGGSFARFVKDLTKPAPTPTPTPTPAPAPADSGSTQDGAQDAATGSTPEADAATETPAPIPVPDPEADPEAGEQADTASTRRTRAALQTIELEEPEIEFLASPEIAALAGPTPRAVKRLVNVYRLVRTRLVQSGGAPLGFPGAMPPDYPLIALCVAIETGQPVEVADGFLREMKSFDAKMPICVTVGEGDEAVSAMTSEADESLAPTLAKSAGLSTALRRVHQLRGNLIAGDVRKVANLARRYSFNRYR